MDSFTFAEDSTFFLNSKSACAVFGDKDVLALSHCDVKASAQIMSCDYDDKSANIQRLLTHNCVSDDGLREELQNSAMLLDALSYVNKSSSSSSVGESSTLSGRKRRLEKYTEGMYA